MEQAQLLLWGITRGEIGTDMSKAFSEARIHSRGASLADKTSEPCSDSIHGHFVFFMAELLHAPFAMLLISNRS